VLFVGMLSGTYSSICIATPVLADLKEREPEFRQLRKQIAQRASSTKRQAKVAVGNAVAAGQVGEDEPGAPESGEIPAESGEAEATPVSAARPAGGAPRPAAGPRQQPRRSSASQRRPSGKKKRR
jgi:preprotein translocase subunit SecF